MATNDSSLGRCPRCGAEIPEAYLLIRYETAAGEESSFAECPDCEDVITPR